MPILGLFNTQMEGQRRREAERVASGQQSSAETTGAQTAVNQGVDRARKQAFAQAYQNRSNPALAQRQAQEASGAVAARGNQDMALNRSGDIGNARAQLSAMDAQRSQGINNLIGYAQQGAGLLFGSPAADAAAAVAGKVVNAAQGGASGPSAQTPTGSQSSQDGQQSALGALDSALSTYDTEDAFNGLLRTPQSSEPNHPPTAPSQAGQAAIEQALSGGNQAPAYDNKPSAVNTVEAAQIARQKDALMRSHPAVIDPNDPRWQNKQRLLFQQMAGR